MKPAEPGNGEEVEVTAVVDLDNIARAVDRRSVMGARRLRLSGSQRG